MYTVSIEATFSAIHRVKLPDGTLEPLHGHDWVVRAYLSRPKLDDAGMVVDFHVAQATLQAVVADLKHRNLNEVETISGPSPTAEILAEHIFERIRESGLACVRRVEVTEAPGYVAAYEPPNPADRSTARQ